jgi:flagellar protein FlaG
MSGLIVGAGGEGGQIAKKVSTPKQDSPSTGVSKENTVENKAEKLAFGEVEGASVNSLVVDAGEKRLKADEPIPITEKEVEEVVTNLNDFMQDFNRNISFNVDSSSSGVVVEVLDSKTEEVIRQIPSEEILAIRERLSVQSEEDAQDTKGFVFNARV